MSALGDLLNKIIGKLNACVKTVNGTAPDASGNVQIEAGGGVTSWNDLEDRPFGEMAVNGISGEYEFVYEEGSPGSILETTVNNVDVIWAALIAGEPAIITFDGTTYTCSALNVGGMLYYGNPGPLGGGEDNGMPFVCLYVGEVVTFACFTDTATTTHNISFGTKALVKIPEVYMPKEYLPKAEYLQPDWNQTDETAQDYIKNKPNVDSYLFLTYSADSDGVNRLYKDGVMMTQIDFLNYICNTYKTNKKPIAIGTERNFSLPIRVIYGSKYGEIWIATTAYVSSIGDIYSVTRLYTAEYTPTT